MRRGTPATCSGRTSEKTRTLKPAHIAIHSVFQRNQIELRLKGLSDSKPFCLRHLLHVMQISNMFSFKR